MNRNVWLAAVLTGTLAINAPAHALEPKQCLPMADMNAALKAEGQHTLIIGNRVAFRDAPDRVAGARTDKWVNTFTANGEGAGSIGYNLEGNRPMGEPSTTVCVAGKFTNVQLYDARKAGTPDPARRGGTFDVSLRENEAKGTRPMLQADSIAMGPNGTIQRGLGVTLFGNMRVKGGYLVANYPGGKAADLLFIGDTEYTPTALAQLDARSR